MTREGQAMDASFGDTVAPAGSIVIDLGAVRQWLTGHGTAQSAQWADRWLWLFLVPLLSGLVVSVLILIFARKKGQKITTSSTARTPCGGVLKHDQDNSADLAAKLTFLGAAVVAAAQLEIFDSSTVVNAEDLGILLVVNIVFTAIAASHNLLTDLQTPRVMEFWGASGDRLARGVLILSAVGSLTSVLIMIWRTPVRVAPGFVQLMFSLLLITAAVIVCAYVRARLPEKSRTGAKSEGAAEEGQASASPPEPTTPLPAKNGTVIRFRPASDTLISRVAGNVNRRLLGRSQRTIGKSGQTELYRSRS